MPDLNSQLQTLATAAQEGDEGAFGQIFDLMSDPIFRFVAARLNDREAARDIVSQVFLEAWKSLPRYNPKLPFRAWLYTIAKYRLIDHYRAHHSTVSLEAVTDRAGVTDLSAENETASEVDSMLMVLSTLPELYQTVIRLKYLSELDYSEIAKITGKSENSLRVIVKRGLDKLREQLATSI